MPAAPWLWGPFSEPRQPLARQLAAQPATFACVSSGRTPPWTWRARASSHALGRGSEAISRTRQGDVSLRARAAVPHGPAGQATQRREHRQGRTGTVWWRRQLDQPGGTRRANSPLHAAPRACWRPGCCRGVPAHTPCRGRGRGRGRCWRGMCTGDPLQGRRRSGRVPFRRLRLMAWCGGLRARSRTAIVPGLGSGLGCACGGRADLVGGGRATLAGDFYAQTTRGGAADGRVSQGWRTRGHSKHTCFHTGCQSRVPAAANLEHIGTRRVPSVCG